MLDDTGGFLHTPVYKLGRRRWAYKKMPSKLLRDTETFAKLNRQYKRRGLRVHMGKRCRRLRKFVLWGAEVDGLQGEVGAPKKKILVLQRVTL